MATQHELMHSSLDAGTGETLLAVEGLSVAYGDQQVVSDVSFTLGRGESLALIGESGSGKTTIARTVLRLLPKGAQILGGEVSFDGKNIARISDRGFRPLGMEPVSVGVSADAHHIITPSVDGPRASIQQALAEAHADVSEVGTWDLHATATPGDYAEMATLRSMLCRWRDVRT